MPTKKRPDWKTLVRRFWLAWGRPFLVVAVVLCTLRSAVADWNDVPTGSMKPTIMEGDRIFVNKTAYGLRVPFTRWWMAEWNGPQRGDIVVLTSPDDGTRLVKRVVGLPGDRLEIRANRLLINDLPADYEKIDPEVLRRADADILPGNLFAAERIDGQAHPVMVDPRGALNGFFPQVTVPPGHYFVMGDNRSNSRDSRVFGFVPRSHILGKSTAVVVSFDLDNYYLPRWNRFFRRLP